MVSQWVRFIDRVIIRECIRLARLGHVRIDAQELIGRRVVVAVDSASVGMGGRAWSAHPA
jgi:hypothetical protein